jgi:fermentation-respiration switch protein FrsA (DUF1100 family)
MPTGINTDNKEERMRAFLIVCALLLGQTAAFASDLDPTTALAKVRCPVFAFFGERDMQIPPATNRPPLEAALARAGNDRRDGEGVSGGESPVLAGRHWQPNGVRQAAEGLRSTAA